MSSRRRAGAMGALLAGAGRDAPQSAPRPVPAPPAVLLEKPSQPPPAEAPLAIRLVYPAPTDLVEGEDSSFFLGSVGDGRATMAIDGTRLPVAPNGACLAWLRSPDAALVEGLFIIGPEEEAALRPETARRRSAEAVVDGGGRFSGGPRPGRPLVGVPPARGRTSIST